MTDLAAKVGFGALLIAVAIASVWIDRAVTGRVETKTETEVVEVPSVFDPMDLLTGTTPQTRKEYEAPDSSDTQQRCFVAPTWLPKITTPDGLRQQSGHERSDSAAGTPNSQMPNSLLSAGLPYVITPMTQGSPTLSVGSRQVVLQSLSPRDGSAITYEYDVPRPSWRITAQGALTAGSGYAVGASTLGLSHRTPVGWLRVGIGYGGVVTDRAQTGLLGRVGIRKTLHSW